MPRRPQHVLWKSAGRVAEEQATGDDVVRATGWVFNNMVGRDATIADFVATGDEEVRAYLTVFDLYPPADAVATLVEIGSGIGRMTCAFTREFDHVVACDVDAGFLERCRETVASFGRVDRLRTVQVADGATLPVADSTADVAFSYITLQHCTADDALDLAAEAVRVTKSGGKIALNLRARGAVDIVLGPAGGLARALVGLPKLGAWCSQRRTIARLAWQANRLRADAVLARIGADVVDATVWRHPRSSIPAGDARVDTYEGLNRHHYWVVATVR